jgi:hypothetical protein
MQNSKHLIIGRLWEHIFNNLQRLQDGSVIVALSHNSIFHRAKAWNTCKWGVQWFKRTIKKYHKRTL